MSVAVTKIQSSDGKVFSVPEKVIFQSKMIKNLVSDLPMENDEPIPLPNVNSATMEKIIVFLEHHQDSEPESEEELKSRDSEKIDPWDREFMKLDDDMIRDIILAANYLDISRLLTLGCKTIANIVKNKSVEEIREYFGLPKDGEPEKE